jgi:hypothetical protein
MKKIKNQKNGLKFLLFGLMLLSSFCFDFKIVYAVDGAAKVPGLSAVAEQNKKIINPFDTLNVQIPGLAEIAKEYPATCTTTPDDNTSCSLPYIAVYIKAVFNYVIIIIGIVAAVVLMIGGIVYVVSAGNASRVKEAQGFIGASITGLLVALTSYMLLNEVNPELTRLKVINLTVIPEYFMENSSDSEANIPYDGEATAGSGHCPTINELKNLTGLVGGTNAGSPNITPEAYDALSRAVEIAKKQGVKLFVSSAFRSMAEQTKLWNQGLAKYKTTALTRKYVAPPGTKCYSHMAGSTVDLCIMGSASCGHIGFQSAANATYSDADTKKLQAIMQEAGWIRYCNEWWHFQFNDKPKLPCSP